MTGLFQDLSDSFNPTVKPTITPRFKTRFETDSAVDAKLLELEVEETNQLESKYIDSAKEPSRKEPESHSQTQELQHSEVMGKNDHFITNMPVVALTTENDSGITVAPHIKETLIEQSQLSEKQLASDFESPKETKEKAHQKTESTEQPSLKETETIIERSIESKQSNIEVQTEKVVYSEKLYKEPDPKISQENTGAPVKHTIHIGRIDVKASTPSAPPPKPTVALTPIKLKQASLTTTRGQQQSQLTAYLGWGK